MRVNSFYSIRKDLKVYHNNNKCTEGNNIEPKNFKHGILPEEDYVNVAKN